MNPKTLPLHNIFGFKRRKLLIARREYLDKLITFRDKQLIKVVTGVRRYGKSTLFAMLQDWLLANGIPPSNIIAVNLEDFENAHLCDPATLHEYVVSRMGPRA